MGHERRQSASLRSSNPLGRKDTAIGGPNALSGTLQLPLHDAAAGRHMNWVGGSEVQRDYIFVPDAMRLAAELSACGEAYGHRRAPRVHFPRRRRWNKRVAGLTV